MWLDELTKVRRFLRDPDGNIWSDAFLKHLWNDVQKDVQNRIGILEDVIAQRIPDLYHCSYLYDWEWSYLPSQYSEFFQALRKHDEYVFCHAWEPQEITSISSDAVELGAHCTQPWEAFMGQTVAEEIRMKFPKNFRDVKFMAYDEAPIIPTTRKLVQSMDSSYLTTTGTVLYYYEYESLDRSYVLYPKPSTAFVDDPTGEGIAFYVEDDTEDTTVGTIAIRTGSSESGNVGASVDVIGIQDNILMVYDVSPTDVDSISSEIDFPDYVTKYIRFGVVGRAYDANTDGRIVSLARFWNNRYEIGIKTLERFMRKRRQDRDYRLTTKPSGTIKRRRWPRLPSTYPDVGPIRP